jgi:hypothetical protein
MSVFELRMVAAVLLVGLTVGLAAGTPALAQESITLDEVAATLKLTDTEKKSLMSGDFVQREAEETSKKELAAMLLLLIPEPLDKCLSQAENLDWLRADQDVIAFEDLGSNPTADGFEGAVFTPDEGDEIRKLANVKPGSNFNLSKDEIATLQKLRREHTGRCDKNPACAQAFNEAYSNMLFDRLQAYRQGGVAAIAPYDRGEDEASPAEELTGGGETLNVLKKEMPSLYAAFMEYPASQIDGVEHTFVWKKHKAQDRPTFSLLHRMMHEGENLVILLEREFYVSQSYNSLMTASGAFAKDDQTLLVYLNRTSTDQVAGFGSSMRHGIGRKMMVSEIKKNYADFKALIEGGG